MNLLKEFRKRKALFEHARKQASEAANLYNVLAYFLTKTPKEAAKMAMQTPWGAVMIYKAASDPNANIRTIDVPQIKIPRGLPMKRISEAKIRPQGVIVEQQLMAAIDQCMFRKVAMVTNVEGFITDRESLYLRDMLWYARDNMVPVVFAPAEQDLIAYTRIG